MHVLIALNPQAGARAAADRVAELARLVERSGLSVSIEKELSRFETRAAELREAGQLHAVVSAGGDGTAAAVVNRIAADVPIAIYPLGTENLLAKAIGQSGTPRALHETLIHGIARRFDAGLANGRLFLIMLSAGFDATVVERAHDLRTGNIDRWHYVRPIRETLRRYRFADLKLTYTAANDQQTATAQAKWAFVFNWPRYAGGLPIAPQATAVDGALDLCTFERGSIWHGLRYLASVILRRHHRLADFATSRVTKLRIDAEDRVPYQIDGDPGGELPVEIEVLPARLCLLLPPGADAK